MANPILNEKAAAEAAKAGWAAPDDATVHAGRAAIYLARRKAEPSLMSKGIFAAAARESQIVVERNALPSGD